MTAAVVTTATSNVWSMLFSGGQPLMVWWFLMAGIDLLTGLFKALRRHRWKSSIDWTGLMKHFVTLLTIIMASAIDHVAPIVGVTLPVNVGLVWTAILLTYEFGSIVENAGELGINIGPLKKYLAIFDEAVMPDSDNSNKTTTPATKHSDGDSIY